MKHTIIVTPLYFIDNKLVDVLREESDGLVTILITDDVSPIFPIEIRSDWAK